MEPGSKDVSNSVQCPVCSIYFDESTINAHVNECLNTVELGDDDEFEKSFEVPSSDLSENETKPVETKPVDTSQFSSVDHLFQSATDSHLNVTKDVKDREGELESKKDEWSFLKSPKATGMHTKGGQSSKTIMPKSVHHLSTDTRPSLSQQSRKQKSGFDVEHENSITSTKSFNSKRPKLQTDAKESDGLNSKFMESVASEATQTMKMNPQNVNSGSGSSVIQPLAEKMRPLSLDEFVGQEQVVGNNTMLRRLLELQTFPSMILWGPPGCGKVMSA